MTHVFITGICGNIGSHTAQQLIRQGHQVSGIDLQTKQNEKVARSFQKKTAIHWGDIRDKAKVAEAMMGQDVVVHLAYILPPTTYDHPHLAEEVNMDGTRNVVASAQAQAVPPKLLFASSLDVFGHTQEMPPPRTLSDPVYATDDYTRQKLAGEKLVQESGLTWAIFRFADVPPISARDPHPIMFRIPLDTRFEMLHPDDAGLAVANGIALDALWGAIWLIGGGKSCQVLYRDYLNSMLLAMGIGALPDSAFGHDPYCTDWLDTTDSERLLHYQHHSYNDIIHDVAQALGAARFAIPIVRPFVRHNLLQMSEYYQK